MWDEWIDYRKYFEDVRRENKSGWRSPVRSKPKAQRGRMVRMHAGCVRKIG